MEKHDIGLRYRLLVQRRRELGDSRYGDGHLRRRDLADNRVQEVADAVVYLTLAARAWGAGQLPANFALEDRLARLVRDLLRLGELCTRAAGAGSPPDAFAAVLSDRFAYGQSHHGDAYLRRENLAEALEEIADCQILVALERERDLHLSATPDDQQLQEISDRCAAAGELTVALRDAALSQQPAENRSPPTGSRQSLVAEREALARLLARTRRYLRHTPDAAQRHARSPGRRPKVA
jgi:hypothetical protein